MLIIKMGCLFGMDLNNIYGILLVDKEKGITSRDVVNKISKNFNIKKVGHAGTLDPLATGLLVVGIGKATKILDLLTMDKKEYIATVKMGIQTDTFDITGKIIEKNDNLSITKQNLQNTLAKFCQTYMQVPPKYSAIKVKGKKLYEYARENIDIELPRREIDIKEIKLLDFKDDTITFKTVVSKGTYIRSLINDIGKKLNTYATMAELKRTKQGNFSIEDSYTLDDIENNNYKLLTYEDIFNDYEKYNLNDEEYFKVKNGQKMPINFENKEVVYTYKGEYIALYERLDKEAKIKIML